MVRTVGMMVAVGMALSTMPAAAGFKDVVKKLGSWCKVKVKVVNKCGSQISVVAINFWHKDTKNKYTILTLKGDDNVASNGSKNYKYDLPVMHDCKTKKRAELSYITGWGKKGLGDGLTDIAMSSIPNSFRFSNVSNWTSGDTVTVTTGNCKQ